MTRDQKIKAIRNALTDEQRRWLWEVIEDTDVKTFSDMTAVGDGCEYEAEDAEATLQALADEFR